MPDLGTKHECTSCSTKFYDLGQAEPVCPKCGLNQLSEEGVELAAAKPAKKPAKKKAKKKAAAKPRKKKAAPAEKAAAPAKKEGGDAEGKAKEPDK